MNRLPAILLLICSVGCNQTLEPSSNIRPSEEIIDHATYDDSTHCELHKVPLSIGYAPIEYGLSGDMQAYQTIRRERFPHADDPVNEGCIVGPWRKARVKVCYQCQSAYSTWKRTERINQSEE